MHLPDGFLDARTAAAGAALSAAGVAIALRRLRSRLPPRRVPLLGLFAAFVFAAQMINFPVAGGTSGHLVGSVLTAVILGPSAAVVVLSCVLIIQALLFADGGLMALGANALNMALIGGVGGYAVYRIAGPFLPGRRGQVAAAAFAGWCSAVLAAAAAAAELALSGTVEGSRVLPAMVSVYMVIGLGEAIITAVALVAMAGIRPDLVPPERSPAVGRRFGASLALLMAIAVAWFALPPGRGGPDGLERVAGELGFAGKASRSAFLGPFPDYGWPAGGSPGFSAILVGSFGTVLAFGLALLLARWLVPRPPEEADGGLP